jgi:hypothetical protein
MKFENKSSKLPGDRLPTTTPLTATVVLAATTPPQGTNQEEVRVA